MKHVFMPAIGSGSVLSRVRNRQRHKGPEFKLDPVARVGDILSREGLYLDRKDWPAWIAMYHPDATYWVPAWKDEDTPTSGPDTEISLIYHDNRFGLEERIARIQSRK